MNNVFNMPTRINNIIDVLPMQQIARIDRYPSYLLGAIIWRDSSLPIVNLQLAKANEHFVTSGKTAILVIELLFKNQTIRVGVVVDSEEEMSKLKDEMISLPPDFMEICRSIELLEDIEFENIFNEFCFG